MCSMIFMFKIVKNLDNPFKDVLKVLNCLINNEQNWREKQYYSQKNYFSQWSIYTTIHVSTGKLKNNGESGWCASVVEHQIYDVRSKIL